MRPAQRKHLSRSTVPNRRKTGDLSLIVKPLVYGCDPAPVAKLAHKYVRVLKRLASGTEKIVNVAGTWYWHKLNRVLSAPGGKVKSSLLTGLRALGYIVNIGGTWCITSNGMQAVAA